MQHLTTSGRARMGLRSRTLMRTIAGLVGFVAPLMGQSYNINTFAGSGPTCTVGNENSCHPGSAGDNGQAASAQLNFPQAVAIDNSGNVYIADSNNFRIRKVTTGGVITTIAGNGTAGYSGDNGAATSATLTRVKGIAVDNNGNVYIADTDNNAVRKISGGTITTIAGTGVSGYSGDGGPATNAKLSTPVGVAVDTQNNVYIADLGNARVRKISNGTISTVAGNGAFGFSGDGGQATSAAVYPYGIAVDSNGNLYIAESANERVRKVSGGVINTIAGNGTVGYSGDGGQAISAQLDTPSGVTVDSAGQVFIIDTVNDVVRKVGTNGVISTAAGTANSASYGGDNGPATSAQLNLPYGIGVGSSSNTVYIADTSNNRIRALTPGVNTPPFGSFDTPANNSTGAGAVNVTGWALSQPAVSTVGIYREPISGETPGSNGLVFLGNAALVPGARPDVAAAYPGYPNNNWGWGVQVLTNELPGTGGQGIGNGTYRLHVIAMNSAGSSTDLGTKTITAANATSVLPFGTIDTPAPGAVASGAAYVNFGWAVTPVTSNIIPKDGSTITVFIDNQPVGHPTYNQFRSDIATLFPGLQNSQGAVGFYTIDTTKLANGIHTIAWVAADSAGNAQGLGSRQFTVQN